MFCGPLPLNGNKLVELDFNWEPIKDIRKLLIGGDHNNESFVNLIWQTIKNGPRILRDRIRFKVKVINRRMVTIIILIMDKK